MESKKADVKKVMISSTARDLPEHRKQVMDACLRQSMLPVMMERLPANDLEAISASLKMVDEADIYLGVYAFRYGYVPKDGNPEQISVTEMEYRRAKERGIPRLIFIIDKEHPVRFEDVEMGESAEKLKIFKEKIGLENILNFFKSAEELRSFVIHSLSQLPKDDKPHQFHYVHPIPAPPEPYIAHPYTLLQARGLFGRQPELNLLTDWIIGKGSLASVRIFNVIAIGGMGKSALTWHWFQNVAPLEMPNMASRFWWSFYESDAYFENFVIRALAYVSRRSIEEVQKINVVDREAELLRILDRESHLLVLDGLERILIAYARMDAAHLADDDYDKQTANWAARVYGLPESAAQSFTGEHRLRKTADPRAGNFLRKLARVGASRILVSSRLYPFDLQMLNGEPGPGCSAIFLRGLNDDDALDLWRNFGVSGQRDELLRLFRTFENHPLLVQTLAGEIARYRPAPGDFDRWRKDKPDFDPFSLPLKQAKSHVLFHSMHGLSEAEQKALHTIAAFRMPAQYETLQALLIGKGKPCADEEALDALLNELEDRGLVGWDRRANRYDLHPVVRGVVWSGVSETGKKEAYSALHGYFDATPKIEYDDVESIEDLTPAIEMYHALMGLGRFDDAFEVFKTRLEKSIHYRLSLNQKRVELLQLLLSEDINSTAFSTPQNKPIFYHSLGQGLLFTGNPEKSIWFFRKELELGREVYGFENLSYGLGNFSHSLRLTGKLTDALNIAQESFEVSNRHEYQIGKANGNYFLGIVLSTVGKRSEAETKFLIAIEMFSKLGLKRGNAFTRNRYAQLAIWNQDYQHALTLSKLSWELSKSKNVERDFIRAVRIEGESLLFLKDYSIADKRLHHALTRARAINFVEEELPALIALAELRRRQGKPEDARQLLDDVWEAAERGPYPLFHADACNVLCQLERDAGNIPAAIAATTQSYRLAWCDGPPWAYHYGLENAKKHLRELGAVEPVMEKRE